MQIRKATLNDLDAVTALEAECFPAAEAATKEVFRERLSAFADHFWLLWDGNRLVSFVNGMATNMPDLTDAMYADAASHQPDGCWQMIFGVNTAPAYRQRGCAAAVLRQVIADTRAAGRKGLVLTCKTHMLHYYAKFGFVNEGLSESDHGGAQWYQMRLTF